MVGTGGQFEILGATTANISQTQSLTRKPIKWAEQESAKWSVTSGSQSKLYVKEERREYSFEGSRLVPLHRANWRAAGQLEVPSVRNLPDALHLWRLAHQSTLFYSHYLLYKHCCKALIHVFIQPLFINVARLSKFGSQSDTVPNKPCDVKYSY